VKSTPIYALPYPEESDSSDVPRDVQALAQRLEAVLPNVGIPTGAGIDWYAAVAPAGFLLCDGSAVSRTTYAALYAAIGVTWGGGDGINTFNLPDTRARVLVGLNSGGPNHAALGGNDGTPIGTRRVLHSHTVSLTLPAHGHSVNDPGHNHGLNNGPFGGNAGVPGAVGSGNHDGDWTSVIAAATGISVGNPTSAPAIPGSVGVPGPIDGPAYIVVAKAIKT
jgi:microcystin-dependent protein